jgi:hypothetical protein
MKGTPCLGGKTALKHTKGGRPLTNRRGWDGPYEYHLPVKITENGGIVKPPKGI